MWNHEHEPPAISLKQAMHSKPLQLFLLVLIAGATLSGASTCAADSLTGQLQGKFFASVRGPGGTACENVGAGASCTVSCRQGFEGGSITCDGNSGKFSITGCTALPSHCAADSITVDGSHFSKLGGVFRAEVSDATCNDTPALSSCTHECSAGYEGGAVTCQGNGLFLVDPCVKVSEGDLPYASVMIIVAVGVGALVFCLVVLAACRFFKNERGSAWEQQGKEGQVPHHPDPDNSPANRVVLQEELTGQTYARELTGIKKSVEISRFDSRFAGSIGAGIRTRTGEGSGRTDEDGEEGTATASDGTRGRGGSGSVLEKDLGTRKPSAAMLQMMETGDDEQRGIRFKDLGFDDDFEVAIGGDEA